jgi:hypothetical protein
MNEINNRSSELSGELPHGQSEDGDRFLGEGSSEYQPTQEEMETLALEGVSLLFIDCLKGK